LAGDSIPLKAFSEQESEPPDSVTVLAGDFFFQVRRYRKSLKDLDAGA
jgi:hypothetical protein